MGVGRSFSATRNVTSRQGSRSFPSAAWKERSKLPSLLTYAWECKDPTQLCFPHTPKSSVAPLYQIPDDELRQR